MGFVNEKISEAEQQCINYGALKDPHGGRSLVGTPKWTVDRERNAFFLRLGGGMSREDYHVPSYFLFNWQEVRMRVDAFKKRVPSDDPVLAILTWEVISVSLLSPGALPGSREEIMHMLTEAFVAYGETGIKGGSHLNLKAVRVDFSKLRVFETEGGNKP